MKELLFVASGGAIGAASRYLISLVMKQSYSYVFPWHTFLINISGCLLIGASFSLIKFFPNSETLKLFIMAGVLGGYTTFSSFGLETFQMISSQMYIQAAAYIIGSFVLGLLAVVIGYSLTQLITA